MISRDAHSACSFCLKTNPILTPSVLTQKKSRSAGVGLALTAGLLFVAVFRVQAQAPEEDWPPDDAYPGQAAPQYTQSQPYGYRQPVFPQQVDGQHPYAYGPYPQGYGQQLNQQPLSPEQLTQLVAPIALYPDGLVAQVLAASTYPAQVSAADQWLRSMGGGAPPDQIAAGANAQTSWDPSVKALTAFPQVLDMLSSNLQWATALGNAYYNQPQDVLQTIQVMRERAENAGTLRSTPQEAVTENQGYIDIAPPDPNLVSVPSYDPWSAYGRPVDPYPGFSLLGTIASGVGQALLNYGPGIAMSAFSSTPFGWLGWGLDWLAHAVLFNHDIWCTHSESVADWGFPDGGPRFDARRERDHGWARDGWGRDRGGWGRGGEGWRQSGGNQWNRDGYNRAYGSGENRGLFGRPIDGPSRNWGDARTQEGFNRGFPARGDVHRSPLGQQAYNHMSETFPGRLQSYDGGPRRTMPTPRSYSGGQGPYERPGYGSGFLGQPRDNHLGRSGSMAFANPSQSFRAPENSYRGGIGSYAYGGSGFTNGQRSGGFHLFGGGHSYDGYKPSKNYGFNGGGGHSSWYGGGHSSWGGGGGWKAPKESHSSGGGGHSFGGSHWSGGGHWGGHSGGGHSGGGGAHSGGHHH